MTLHSDDELRSRFHELRDDDRAQVPPFRALLDRPEVRTRATRRARATAVLWMAAAASVVLAAGVVLRWSGDGDPVRFAAVSPPPGATLPPSISDWTSPTAGLLRTPGRDLLAPPSILASILDGVTRTPGQRKGDRQ